MDKELFRRHGWVVYLCITLLGSLFVVLAVTTFTTGDPHAIMLSMGVSFFSNASLYFIIKEFALFNPDGQKMSEILDRLSRVLDMMRSEKVEFIGSRERLYDYEREKFQQPCSCLRVFAANEINAAILNGEDHNKPDPKPNNMDLAVEMTKKGVIGQTIVTFGLPPIKIDNKFRDKHDIVADLYAFEQLAFKFNGLMSVKMQFLPPSETALGMAVLIFERQDGSGEFSVGFSTQPHYSGIDSGFVSHDQQMFLMMRKWYDGTIINHTTDEFVLQDKEFPISKRWANIVARYYGNEVARLLKEHRKRQEKHKARQPHVAGTADSVAAD